MRVGISESSKDEFDSRPEWSTFSSSSFGYLFFFFFLCKLFFVGRFSKEREIVARKEKKFGVEGAPQCPSLWMGTGFVRYKKKD